VASPATHRRCHHACWCRCRGGNARAQPASVRVQCRADVDPVRGVAADPMCGWGWRRSRSSHSSSC
jgi:hypothetical protein